MTICSYCGRRDGTHSEDGCPAYRPDAAKIEAAEGLVRALEFYAAEADNMFDFARTPALKGTSNAHRALAEYKRVLEGKP